MPGDDEVFEAALRRVAELEGGWSDVPGDHGGATMLGVSLRYLREKGVAGGGDLDHDGDVDAEDVRAVRAEHVRKFFRDDFWVGSGADRVARHSPQLAAKLFEMSVVSGAGTAVRALQRALGDLTHAVGVDGRLGSLTEAEIARVNHERRMGELVMAYRRRCAQHFLDIVDRDRTQIKFALGWLRRALDLDRAG